MKIDEAIKKLEPYSKPPLPFESAEFCEVIKLGIEALKRIYLQREHPKRHFNTLLSGEEPPEPKTIPVETLVKIRESPLGREPRH